jgi:hypothetical protein
MYDWRLHPGMAYSVFQLRIRDGAVFTAKNVTIERGLMWSFLGFIRDNPPYPRHLRSITPYTDLKSALIFSSGDAWRIRV